LGDIEGEGRRAPNFLHQIFNIFPFGRKKKKESHNNVKTRRRKTQHNTTLLLPAISVINCEAL
jgi:hypothetical protein